MQLVYKATEILHWTSRVALTTNGGKPGTVTIQDIVFPSSTDDTLKPSQRLNNSDNRQLDRPITTRLSVEQSDSFNAVK